MKCRIFTNTDALLTGQTLAKVSSSASQLGVTNRCENWTIKRAEHWGIDAFKLALKKSLESPLDSIGIKPANLKGNQPWIFIVRTDAPIPRPPDTKSWLIGKESDAGKDWGQEKGATEDEWLNSITDSMDMTLSKFQEIVKDREAGNATVHRVAKIWKQLSNWTTTR